MRRLLLTVLLCASLIAPLVAANPVETGHVRARLIAETDAAVPGATLWVALHLAIDDGWHTYWRNPGDSGTAPMIDWQLPPGWSAGAIQWPHPAKITVGPLANYGYSGSATHLVPLAVPDDARIGATATLTADAEWLVCEEICIPEQAQLVLTVPVQAAADNDPRWSDLFARTRAALPVAVHWPVTFSTTPDHIDLTVRADDAAIGQAEFFGGEFGLVEHAAAQRLTHGDASVTLRIPRGERRGETLAHLEGVLVVRDDGRSRAYRVDLHRTASAGMTTLLALVGGFVGGLLLNLMPCVFPVLSVKALGLVQHSRGAPALARRHGYVFTAGVLVSMALLAAALLAARAAGQHLGWGFQLQSPVVVLALAWLMTALGLLMSGRWEFGARLMGLGGSVPLGEGFAGSFGAGALAVVVATPCTAPFMGTALGFAVTRPAPVAMGIFLALGLGLAAPWLLLSVWPALQRLMPAPGRWMETLKQWLAVPMYASALWLVWVLWRQTGLSGMMLAAAGIAAMLAVSFGRPGSSTGSPARRVVPIALALTLAVLAVGVSRLGGPPPAPAAAATQFTSERLATLRAEGRPVFVNFTAAWCITCLVNERVALGSAAVRARMAEKGVVYLEGDWTLRDPEITAVLSGFGRNGVPLYLLYPARGAPEVLPQILTESGLLARLDAL